MLFLTPSPPTLDLQSQWLESLNLFVSISRNAYMHFPCGKWFWFLSNSEMLNFQNVYVIVSEEARSHQQHIPFMLFLTSYQILHNNFIIGLVLTRRIRKEKIFFLGNNILIGLCIHTLFIHHIIRILYIYLWIIYIIKYNIHNSKYIYNVSYTQ